MATRLLLISDTHGRALPESVWAAVDSVDLVIHAGDWVSPALLDELSARVDVLGVWGNNDGDDLRARLPEVARRSIEGLRFAVVHETGPSGGRDERMRRLYPDVDVLVFGHSHIPWDAQFDGLRLLNPGSPTDRRRQPTGTYMLGAAHEGSLAVELLPV